jgi:iron complex outermembrane receptor protein
MAIASASANAQEVGSQIAQAPQDPSAPPDEIIVTATKRAESVQKVPIAITAVSGDALTKLGVLSTDKIQMVAPGLSIAAVGSGFVSYTYIRGGGTNQIDIGADPSVAYFVDEIYIGGSAGLQFDLFDIDHVEVLKGPQGTLFGRNAASGAISIVTKRPSATQQGYVSAEGGNYGTFVGRAGLTGPINGALNYRVALGYKRHNGYTENLGGGEDPGKLDTLSGRAQLEWHGDDVSFLVTADGLRGRSGQTNQFMSTDNKLGNLSPAAAARFPLPGERFYAHYYMPGFENQDLAAISGRLEWNTPVGDLTSITAYRYNRFWRVQDQNPGANALVFDTDEKDRLFSQELRLASDSTGPFKWLAGLYFYRANQTERFTVPSGPDFAILPLRNVVRTDLMQLRTTSYAAFTQLNYNFTERLALIVGARFTRDEKSDKRTVSSTAIGSLQNYQVHPSKSWNAFTPAITVQYDFDRDAMLYASFKKGFKSGGFQPFLPANATIAASIYEPEKVDSFEIGAKTSWLDRRLTINLDGFYSRITNQQVAQGSVGAVLTTTNAGRTTAKGVDLSIVARPISPLRLGLDVTYQKARYDKYDTVIAGLPASYAGKSQQRSPDLTLSFNGQYDLELSDGSTITASGTYAYRSKQFFDPANVQAPGLYQPGYDLADLRLTYTPSHEDWDIGAWVRNVGDTHYARNIVVNGLLGITAPGDPRTFGGTLNVRF